MLARAQRFGVTDAESRTPQELEWLLTHLERQQEQLAKAQAKPPEPEKKPAPEEEPINWGRWQDEDGNPLTAESDKKAFAPWQYDSIVETHQAKLAARRADARAAAAEERLAKAEQERNNARAEGILRQTLATRPELFGEKPGQAPEGSVEAERYKLVYRYLATLP